MKSRPILLGMNNPLSSEPEHALYPLPPGCTGARIYEMLSEIETTLQRHEYLRMFDRRNLVSGRAWSMGVAREEAEKLHQEVGQYPRTVIVLGAQTWKALGFPQTDWLREHADLFNCSWWRVPHPSGLNPWYNDMRQRRRAARLMLRLARGTAS